MAEKKQGFASILFLVLVLSGVCSVSAAFPAKLVGGLFSNAASAILKRLWTITSAPKTVISGRPLMKFESGYTVETVFDGSKLGIEPFSIEVFKGGELLVLDSVNSNIFRISLPLSRYSRPKLVAGSAEGYPGHVDGKPREARLNHPKSLTVDDRGNIYVADTMNMAIRKISDTGVTTIAGGRWNKGGHIDGPSEDAKFSNDFEVVYVGSSCSLLVVDRGNQAIREIQLHFDDCAYQYETSFPLGVAVLFAAIFFGYMLALLQRRVGVMVSSEDEPVIAVKTNVPPPYQKPMRGSVRPPLIPDKNEPEKQQEEEGFSISNVKLLSSLKSSLAEIIGIIFRRKPHKKHHSNPPQQWRHNSFPMQESFVIANEDEPPPVETRSPMPRKTYAFMSHDPEKIQHLRQGQVYFDNWDGKMILQQQKYQQQQQQQQQQVHQHRQYSSGPQTFYEQNCENTNEIVFGAVQEDRKRTMEIRAINYGDTYYDQFGMRYRIGSSGFSNGY
ncbi:uncharacterized protein LOC110018293 [Phalaenopsis equestris]|uniref:uncharacterized protein LOC110018293 n=1 Tax=Phalaenopsis equestris TaxID=78828 RepID=UPI0009E44B50|nr:uncharacterized protein LOC110018293 [Phalaenopsis equestris]